MIHPSNCRSTLRLLRLRPQICLLLNACLMVLLGASLSTAQDSANDLPLWQQIRNLQIQRADIERKLVNKQIESALAVIQWKREEETAKQAVVNREFELRKYQKGLYPAEQQRLSDDVDLAQKKYEQGEIHLEWSEKLANKGLVSQESLRADIDSMTRLKDELKTAKDKLHVLNEIALPRTTLKIEMAVSAAKKMLVDHQNLLQITKANFDTQIQLQQEELNLLTSSIGKLQQDLKQAEIAEKSQLSKIQLRQQSLNVKRAESSLQLATDTLRLSASSSQLKQQDSVREIEMAELTLKELEVGNQSVDREKLLELQNEVKSKLTFAQQQRNWGKRVLKKGYITSNQLTKFEIQLLEHQTSLNAVNRDIYIYDEFIHQQQLVDARSRLQNVTSEKTRVDREIELAVTLAEAEVQRCRDVLAAEQKALEYLSK
ncbi:MAG: hypothetical protein MK329_02205 [Pirellulales bacterium]|nr:hypothetical protein [Pirellulales bacterium]